MTNEGLESGSNIVFSGLSGIAQFSYQHIQGDEIPTIRHEGGFVKNSDNAKTVSLQNAATYQITGEEGDAQLVIPPINGHEKWQTKFPETPTNLTKNGGAKLGERWSEVESTYNAMVDFIKKERDTKPSPILLIAIVNTAADPDGMVSSIHKDPPITTKWITESELPEKGIQQGQIDGRTGAVLQNQFNPTSGRPFLIILTVRAVSDEDGRRFYVDDYGLGKRFCYYQTMESDATKTDFTLSLERPYGSYDVVMNPAYNTFRTDGGAPVKADIDNLSGYGTLSFDGTTEELQYAGEIGYFYGMTANWEGRGTFEGYGYAECAETPLPSDWATNPAFATSGNWEGKGRVYDGAGTIDQEVTGYIEQHGYASAYMSFYPLPTEPADAPNATLTLNLYGSSYTGGATATVTPYMRRTDVHLEQDIATWIISFEMDFMLI